MSQPDILRRIAARRRERIAAEGPTLGVELPARRETPVRPFLAAPELICEIKRKSPSAGSIAAIPDPVEQARIYRVRGVPSVSVLTEEDHFGGSLADLHAVKAAFPELAVLRKDFLFDAKDVEVSYRAGADAVLLIGAMLEAAAIGEILAAAAELGLAVLAEAHDSEDLEKLRPYAPALVGINSRDLTTFRVDPLGPLALAPGVDWPSRLVFESGIYEAEQVEIALKGGFSGILVGEAVVRDPERIPRLTGALEAHHRVLPADERRPGQQAFWGGIAKHVHRNRDVGPRGADHVPEAGLRGADNAVRSAGRPRRPLIKICGITREEDARLAVELGADLLGFIIAESPRQLPADELKRLLESLRAGELPAARSPGASSRPIADIPRIGVLVARRGGADGKGSELDTGRVSLARELLEAGLLTALQLHGDERPEECAELGTPYYKAVRPRGPEELGRAREYRSPRILLDGFSASQYGGTGTEVCEEIVDTWREKHPLWLAGGIRPENVGERIRRFEPELIDVASGVEVSPGVKDGVKLRKLFEEIENATEATE